MNRGLYDLVVRKLQDDASLGDRAARLVRASCASETGLARALAEPSWEIPAPAAEGGGAAGGALGLRKLTVGCFRGIGPVTELELEVGPGLTLVAGRNGSGKSSLAEALELLLYGDLSRWDGKSLEWKKGWANIHSDGPVFVEAELVVDGDPEPLVVRREWTNRNAKPGAGTVTARRGERGLDGSGLPDGDRLSLYRPILSYGDLGRRLEGKPSELFDDVAGMLGLDELTSAYRRLQSQRRMRKKRYDELRADTEALRQRLEPLDDPRAQEVRRALSHDPWDIEAVREVVHGRGESATELGRLRHVAGLEIPERGAWDERCDGLQQALSAKEALSGTAAGESLQLARLLERAVALHEHGGDTERCPVCEGPAGLDATWRARAQERIGQAKGAAEAAEEAERRVREARAELAELCRFLDEDDIALARQLGLSEPSERGWERWWVEEELAPGALLAHVRAHAEQACRVATEARDLAAAELTSRNESWSALAERLEAWVVQARRSLEEDDAGTVERLKEAERWLRDEEARLREVRFQPIADQARSLWEQMRQDSNVSLDSVSLAAKGGNHRRLELAADVDATGETHPALALMSQGELNVLALSLFLPRVLLDETPFRFVVLDDPVQAMDPHKVDGLARVLDEVARSRQVIVFTHDPRLLEAVDRLGLEATVLQVARGEQSRIEIQQRGSPVQSYIQQAYRMLEHADGIGQERLRRVVPSACRMALEAALQKVARRRLLADGTSHDDTEARLAKTRATIGLASIALFGDTDHGKEVHGELEARFGALAGTYRVAVEYAHAGWDGDLKGLVKDTRRLAQRIEALA